MGKTTSERNVKKKTANIRKTHDGIDQPLPGRKPSRAFWAALEAVKPKKGKK